MIVCDTTVADFIRHAATTAQGDDQTTRSVPLCALLSAAVSRAGHIQHSYWLRSSQELVEDTVSTAHLKTSCRRVETARMDSLKDPCRVEKSHGKVMATRPRRFVEGLSGRVAYE